MESKEGRYFENVGGNNFCQQTQFVFLGIFAINNNSFLFVRIILMIYLFLLLRC